MEADKNKHDDLIMSLGILVSLLHNLVDNNPLELSLNTPKEKEPLSPLRADLKDSYGGMSKENFEWLIK